MNDTFSSIWLEVGLPRKKKILVCNVYREWQYLRQIDNSSLDVHKQHLRWSTFIDQWERALLENKEVVVMGDMNLNHLNWNNHDLPASDQTSKLRSLIDLLFTKIFPHRVSQLVTVATRSWPIQQNLLLKLLDMLQNGVINFFTKKYFLMN